MRQTGRPDAEQRRLQRGLALALVWSSRFRDGIPALDAALAQNPDDADVRRALADARAGVARAPTDGVAP